MIVYDKEQKQIVIPNGLGNVNIIINGGGECPELTEISITENGRYEGAYNVVNVDVPTEGGDKPTPPQDGWGMTGVFNNWGETPDIPFEEDGEWDGRPYKVIRNFEAIGGEFKIRRNNDSTDSYSANFYDIPQIALLIKDDDWNMYIDDGVWDVYLFFGNDGVPNEMLILHTGTDLSTIQYEYTLTISTDKENAIIQITDGYTGMYNNYCGGSATAPMKYGNHYGIGIYMEGYEDIYEELACRNDEERTYTLTKIEGYNCNLISPIVFSKDAGNTINAKNVQIPTFVYEGNQYYNVDSFNLADIEEFKIQILFKPNNRGDSEPINIFGCETSELDSTTFGARIYQGEIKFQIDRLGTIVPYTEDTWYNVEMGYNATKRWVIVNGSTLFDVEHTGLTKPSQTLMIGAINKGGNALRPFYGKIAATYIESNGNKVYLLPKEDGTMGVYWNNLINSRNSISGDNNARFENEYLSGDGMKSITWLGNLEDKWVTPSMSERDDNGYIVVEEGEGYNGLSRVVINPQTLYNEGVEAGRTEGEANVAANARVLNVTENGTYLSKFSDSILPTVTGVYADGTDFYNYAELNGKIFNTKIAGSVDSRLEFWYKGDNTLAGDAYNVIIGSGNNDDSDCFQVRYDTFSNNDLLIGVGNSSINVSGWDDTVWHHLIVSKAEGLWIDGEKKGDFSPTNTINGEFFINGISYDINSDRGGTRNSNGTFGMIKIDDVVFIPTADGFKNVNTGEFLEVVKDGGYTFTENSPIYGEGELYKTINVNVASQCNLGELWWRLDNPSYAEKRASDDGYDGYSRVVVMPENIIAQEKEFAINDFKNKMQEITITENGTYSIDDAESTHSIAFDGNSYFDTGIVPTENIKIEACIKITNGNDGNMGGIIIGGGIAPVDKLNNNSDENRGIAIGMGGGAIYGIWGAKKSENEPYKYEGEGTTTVTLQKTDDSWYWPEGKGSFGASTLYIGGYNRNGEEVEEKFLQSIVYIKIWTNKDDDSTMTLFQPKNMAQGGFGLVNSEGVETSHIENLGEGTATFVEENVKKYPYGFKRVEVNVVPQVSIKEVGLNVWYNDLKRITDENEQINSDWVQALQGETIQNVFPGIAMTISGQAVAKPFFIDRVNGDSTATRIGKLVSNAYGTPVSCAVVIIGAFDCKNIQNVDIEAFKYMTDLCFIDGMNGLGESFISPQTINFTYCTNLFIKSNSRKFISNFAESLFNLSAGNKNGINTSTLKFKSAVQERSENADAIALMQSKGWTVEFVSSDL